MLGLRRAVVNWKIEHMSHGSKIKDCHLVSKTPRTVDGKEKNKGKPLGDHRSVDDKDTRIREIECSSCRFGRQNGKVSKLPGLRI
ncbi:hypothetical protein C1H46_026945 [Malus baccata]|uniref:Uncharacterized protein n=1 Tax=Malus baccata TaxID=106549 RepID=A0A540LM87_MALBA|nr:hypothetical protein C1H46_026945 [Malus baccata]